MIKFENLGKFYKFKKNLKLKLIKPIFKKIRKLWKN
jgi:hypothetical protein